MQRTVLITGASRGIGLAIAERCARDGANIVIAAKSVTEDSRLGGTIHSAAEAVEAAGGQADCEEKGLSFIFTKIF